MHQLKAQWRRLTKCHNDTFCAWDLRSLMVGMIHTGHSHLHKPAICWYTLLLHLLHWNRDVAMVA
jgi:hypothetical protein